MSQSNSLKCPSQGCKPHHARSTQVPRRHALVGGAPLPRDRAVKKNRDVYTALWPKAAESSVDTKPKVKGTALPTSVQGRSFP